MGYALHTSIIGIGEKVEQPSWLEEVGHDGRMEGDEYFLVDHRGQL